MFAYCWQRLSTKQEHRSRVHNTACLKTDKHVQRVGLPVTVLTWQANVSFCSHRKCQIGLSDTPTGQINANERFGYLYKTSVTELSLVENKSAGISVSFSDDYCKQQIDWLMITYIALFSTLLSRLTALACGSTRVTSFIVRFLNIHRSGVLKRWHGWCHMKLQPSRRKFCVHHTTMHYVTSYKATYVRCMRV